MSLDDWTRREEEAPAADSSGDEASETDDETVVSDWAASTSQRQWRTYQQRGTRDHVTTRATDDVCCACFCPIGLKSLDAQASMQLFCRACTAKVQHGMEGISSPSVMSPLPKLSVLVQTEAKYQQQLQLLRQQQELLARRQQEIENRKRVQAETLEMEKQLAKQRRRQFKQLIARRQADEARRLQEIAPPTPDPVAAPSKPRRKEKTMVERTVEAHASSTIEPTPLRRHRIPAPPKSHDTAASKAAELAERAAQEHRRKQHLEVLKCYAQDLTPLIHGNKPKKLPLAAAPLTHSSGKKSKKPLASASKKPPPPSLSPDLRVAIPRQSYETYAMGSASAKGAMPTPLTAEIRPVAWMNELLTEDPVLRNHFMAEHETTDGIDDCDVREPSVVIPPPMGQRVTLAPLATLPPTHAAPPPMPTQTYSSERLASLLQKYNVSVTHA